MNTVTKIKYKALAVALLASSFWAGASYAEEITFYAPFPNINKEHWFISNGWANGTYQSCEWREDAIKDYSNNLLFTLSNRGGQIRPIGCAEMRTTKRTGYGRYEADIRSAAGSGLNTAFFTYIGPPDGVAEHDEIDFEFLGKNPTTVQLNYYTNGKPQDGTIINLGFDASKKVHNYVFDWQANKISWYVDGKLVHTTPAGASIPRNPGYIFLSLWSGSDEKADWLGKFNYTQPVTAEVGRIKFTPF